MTVFKRLQPLLTATSGTRPIRIQVAAAAIMSLAAYSLFFLAIPKARPQSTNTTVASEQDTKIPDIPTNEPEAKTPVKPTLPRPPGLGAALLGSTETNTIAQLTDEQYATFFKLFFALKMDLEKPGPGSFGYRCAQAMSQAIRARQPDLFLNAKISRLWGKLNAAARNRMSRGRRTTVLQLDLAPVEKRLIARQLTSSDFVTIDRLRNEFSDGKKFDAELAARLKGFFDELKKLDTPFIHAAFEPVFCGMTSKELQHPLAPYLFDIDSGPSDPLGTGFKDVFTDMPVLNKSLIRPSNTSDFTSWEKGAATLWQRELRRRAHRIYFALSLDDYDADSFNNYKQRRGYAELIEELRELLPPELPPKYRAELYQLYLLYVKDKPKAPAGPGAGLQEPGVHQLQHTKVKEGMKIVFANGDVFPAATQDHRKGISR